MKGFKVPKAFFSAWVLAGFAALVIACGGSATAVPTPPPVAEPPPTDAATQTHKPASTPSLALAGTPLPTVLLPRIPASGGASLLLDEVVSRGDSPFTFSPVQMQPGQSARFTLSVLECCVVTTEVDAQMVWSASLAVGRPP